VFVIKRHLPAVQVSFPPTGVILSEAKDLDRMKHLGCRRICLIPLLLLLAPAVCFAQMASVSPGPAFTTDPEMARGFRELYAQNFSEARTTFTNWESSHPDEPFGPVAIAASYLFEELYRQRVLTSDFFLDQKRFLNGIDGKPDPARMANFRAALEKTRALSRELMKKNPKDPEALFGLTLAAGMESDADAILEKKQLDGLKRMKEANEYAKQLLALQPDSNDAYVALGAANYIIGSLNPGYRMGLWFMGIHGDKKLGMEQLGKAAESGRYLQPFAKILLALSARREKQTALAQKLLLELSQEFPSSPLFAAEYAKALGRPIPAEMKNSTP
jgi:tetratricopeptide (TPR) repeat protein